MRVQRAAIAIDAIAVWFSAGAFTLRAFGSQGCTRTRGGECSLELGDRIENPTGKDGSSVSVPSPAALTIRAPFFAALVR